MVEMRQIFKQSCSIAEKLTFDDVPKKKTKKKQVETVSGMKYTEGYTDTDRSFFIHILIPKNLPIQQPETQPVRCVFLQQFRVSLPSGVVFINWSKKGSSLEVFNESPVGAS